MTRFAVLLAVMLALSSAYYMPSRRSKIRQAPYDATKRMPLSGNSCPEDRPFPCRDTKDCIPLTFVCDNNWDCDDGLDEDVEVCTAANRLPTDQMAKFLSGQKWTSKLFENKSPSEVAHALAVSPTIDDFQEKLDLSDDSVSAFEAALEAVQSGDRAALVKLGMPTSAWSGVKTLFNKLIETGFL